jgi:hypothetical protein
MSTPIHVYVETVIPGKCLLLVGNTFQVSKTFPGNRNQHRNISKAYGNF